MSIDRKKKLNTFSIIKGADINRAHIIKFPEMQIDNGQTTWVTVYQTCMETKTHQNETPPTSETLLVQNTFSGRHTDLNVKEDVISTDLEACDRKIGKFDTEANVFK